MCKDYKLRDFIIIALIAAMSIIVKPIIKMIPLPMGYTGMFTMMWVILIPLIIDKNWSSTLFCILQAILVLALGIAGKWGMWVLIGYTLPGIVTDLMLRVRIKKSVKAAIAGGTANIAGAMVAAFLFFNFQRNIVIVVIIPAFISGCIGGILAYQLTKCLCRVGAVQVKM